MRQIQRTQRPQKQKKYVRSAKQRNVFAVRRELHPDSQELFREVATRLQPEIGGSGRLFIPEAVTVTIAGFSRFTRDHKQRGPSTLDVLRNVDSENETLTGRLGKMGLFGHKALKLAFNLESESIGQEVRSCERAFANKGVPLRNEFISPDGTVLHCSVALIYQDKEEHFSDERTLNHLTHVSQALNQEIFLLPVRKPKSE